MKRMINEGWAFSEHKMLNKFSERSKQGWHLEKMTMYQFYFKQGESQDVQYAMDYQPHVEDVTEYKQMFEVAGWSYVCDYYGFYIFKANPDTKKIHTDSILLDEWRYKEKKKSITLTIISLIGIAVFSILSTYFNESTVLSSLLFTGTLLMAGLFGMSATLTYGWIFRKGK